LAVCERYDVDTREWFPQPPMHVARCGAQAVFVQPCAGDSAAGAIFVLGGDLTGTVERFSLLEKRWLLVPWMTLPVCLWHFGCHYMDGRIVVFGGTTLSGHYVDDCWSIDPNDPLSTWVPLPPLPVASQNSFFASFVL
jgi:hypothetical protein